MMGQAILATVGLYLRQLALSRVTEEFVYDLMAKPWERDLGWHVNSRGAPAPNLPFTLVVVGRDLINHGLHKSAMVLSHSTNLFPCTRRARCLD